jgi:hypothetical protein
MTTLKIKGYTCTLNGNRLGGKTYEVKNYIKVFLGGKWNGTEWIVDVEKVNEIAARQGAYVQIVETTETVETKSVFGHGWCNKCQSYCYGDCTS